MRKNAIISALAVFTSGYCIRAMSITEMPRAEPTSTMSSDPWQCVTENITQYFNVPSPTGALYDAIISYGDKLLEPCLATATGLDALSCSVSQTSAWCGFSTAAPSSIITAYESYGSAAASFWQANSRTISVIASECPAGWSRPGFSEHAWLNQTIAHAACYMAAHPASTTASSSSTTMAPTRTGSAAVGPTPTGNGASDRVSGADAFMLAGTGIAAAVSAIW
ncbi:hypothetical protein F5Y15DRAFT_263269 [Xylariaceae sp. FL0016]|nr:hypothetical protein F5Y15DRAFT_263269 [Xylariaceae sp. FL0016]